MSYEQAVVNLQETNAELVKAVNRVRDAAMGMNRMYASTAAGIAAVQDGEYFVVPGGGAYQRLYQRSAGSATLISEYPSRTAMEAAVSAAADNAEARAAVEADRAFTEANRAEVYADNKGFVTRERFRRSAPLDLDFTRGKYLVDGGELTETTNASEVLTVQRATPKYALTANGKYREVPIDTLAREWNPETGEYAALIEGSATNELLYSTQFDNVVWIKSRASITPNVGPVLFAGQGGMARLECNATGDFNSRVAQIHTLDTTGWWTGALYASVDVTSWLMITLETPGEGGRRAWFNLSTGEVASTAGVGGTSWSYKTGIKPIGNGVYCCWLSVDMQVLTNPASFFVTCPNGDGSPTSDVGNSVLVSQAQLEQGTRPTSPIITTDAPKTRAADNVKRVLGSEWNNTAGTFVIETRLGYQNTTPGKRIFDFDDGTNQNSIEAFYRASGATGLVLISAGTNVVDINLTDILADGVLKLAVSFGDGNIRVSGNGGAAVSKSVNGIADFLALLNNLSIGVSEAGIFQLNGTVRSARYYPYAMTDTQLQEITS